MSLSRRELLVGVGALAFAPDFLRQEKPVGWAVLGLGSYATNQLMPAMRDANNAKVVALISGTPSKLASFGEQYGVAEKSRYSYERLDDIANNPEIDAVYIVTPPGTHRRFVEHVARLGKHVACEKPMANTVADCQAMIDTCKRAKRLLMIGYRSHYEINNLKAMNLCRSGEYGKITSLSADHGFNIGRGLWRTDKELAGGGSMMDIGIYSVQALCYLTGEQPVEVTSKITNPPNDDRFKEVEADVDFTLTFPSGLVGKGGSGYAYVQGKNEYEVVMEKGTLRANPATAYYRNRLTLDEKDLPTDQNNQFVSEIQHFSECVRTGRPCRTPGEMGLQDIRIIQAIYRAAQTGRAEKV
jgi:glucose-fructose oxidoreductase